MRIAGFGFRSTATVASLYDALDRARGDGEPVQAIATEQFNTGSLAEAAALVAAGPEARLISGRAVSIDKMATAAIAVNKGLET